VLATVAKSPPPEARAPRLPPAQAAAAPAPPIIDEILVEKPEVCEGEENLVTVRAHTPDHADDAYLHYLIAGETGARVPVRGVANPQLVSARQVTVFGRNNVATTVPLPPFRVKDCKVPRRLFIEHRVNPNTSAEFSFNARIFDAAIEPVRYEWDFGDGQRSTTSVPVEVHDFSARRQDALYSQILVRCTAVAADGEQVSGRDSLQLLNPLFEDFAYKGIVTIVAELTPRFPVADADGVVRLRVRLWHQSPGPVHVERVVRLRQLWGQPSPPPEELAPIDVLGSSDIPPEGIETHVELDLHGAPELFAHAYQIFGTSSDGWPARGSFSAMRPTELPTRERNHPVDDPMLRARILRAREILGQAYVTDEDLWRLEREGFFRGLEPAAGLPPGTRAAPPKAPIAEAPAPAPTRMAPPPPPNVPPSVPVSGAKPSK
jgi:hypothetical protein